MKSRLVSVTLAIIMLAMFGPPAASFLTQPADASAAPVALENAAAPANSDIFDDVQVPTLAIFAKYDGIDGEAVNDSHLHWTEIASIDWGASQSSAGASGMARSRGGVVPDNFAITFLYDKSAPKLLEKCWKGQAIPKLEIELTFLANETRYTYLKYELKNVMVMDYHVSDTQESGLTPTVTVANNFEEIKVTYTEYGVTGDPVGNVETILKVQ